MDTKLKTLLAAAAIAVAAALTYWASTLIISPTPSPSPTPSVTTSPLPIPTGTGGVTILDSWERVEYASPSLFKSGVSVSLAAGETTGYTIQTTGNPCSLSVVMSQPVITPTLYVMVPFVTTIPSYLGAKIGTFYEALVPFNQTSCVGAKYLWLDLQVSPGTPKGTVTVQIANGTGGGAQIQVSVNSFVLPGVPTLPMVMQIESYGALLGHGLPGNSNVSVQIPLVQSYVDSLRAHRIEPYKQAVANPVIQADGTLNLTQFNYNQLVLNNRVGPPMFDVGTNSMTLSISYIQAIQKTLLAQGINNAWTYVWDEPSSAQLPQVKANATLVKANAPALQTMVTMDPKTGYSIDIFTQIAEAFTSSAQWMYVSCSAHGSCGGPPGNLTGAPDLVYDHSTAYFLSFPVVASAMGAKGALYYDTMYAYSLGNPWTKQFYFGSNGDGTLFYPGIPGNYGLTAHTPIASMRLKMLRQGSFLVDYGKGKLQNLVTSPTSWDLIADDYKNLRAQIAATY